MKPLRKPSPERIERFAYENRRDPTPAESAMIAVLKDLGWRFNIEHPYPKQNIIVDFLIPAFRMVIEVDGGYHSTRKNRDRQRDRALVRKGFLVQRFTNEQVIGFPKRTKATLLKRISEPVSDVIPRRLKSAPHVREIFVPDLPRVMYDR